MELLTIILLICIPLIVASWSLPEKWQLIPIGLATVLFLIVVSPISFLILLGTMLFSYFLLQKLNNLTTATIIIVIQLAAIFLFFKLEYAYYFNLSMKEIIPLGLSYYAFRQIHYAIEAYKKQLPKHNLLEYFQYLFFIPTILVGPINRFQPFIKDMYRRRWNSSLFSLGLERILYGYFKIIVLGNYLFSHKLEGIANALESQSLWLATYIRMLRFTGNAYMQFAGFSDVAIGLSLLLGFRIIENFNYPFLAQNIVDFWRRWHISLSEWCRDYVYYPFLGMTRNGHISIIASMLVLGLWHEISFRYLIWGAIHALAINIWHRYNGSVLQKKIGAYSWFQKVLGIFITIHFVMLSFVMIQEQDMTASLEVYKILFLLK